MKDRIPTLAAIVASVLVVIVAISPAFAPGTSEFSVERALAAITIIVLSLTAAFGAENLQELRAGRLAEFQPLLDVAGPPMLRPGDTDSNIEITVRNLGRGAAKDLRVRLWRPEDSRAEEWFSTAIYDARQVVGPGEEWLVRIPVLVNSLWIQSAVSSVAIDDRIDFEIQIEYRDPTGKQSSYWSAFLQREDPETGRLVLTRVDPVEHALDNAKDRAARLTKRLEQAVAISEESVLPWTIRMPKRPLVQLDVGDPVVGVSTHIQDARPAEELIPILLDALIVSSAKIKKMSQPLLEDSEEPPEEP